MLLRATDFHATYTVTKPFTFPHHSGSLLRGVLGRALRRTGCARSDIPCAAACDQPTACVYSRLFDPPVPSPPPHRFLKDAVAVPPRLLPLLPPPRNVALAEGETLGFGVRVLGRLDDDEEKRLVGAIEGIADLPLGTERGRVAFDTVTRRGQRNREVRLDDAPDAEGRLRVIFETPAWLEQRKKLAQELTFPLLFRTIYRRLTVVGALYGELGADHEDAFARLDALAAEVKTVGAQLRPLRWERLSEESGERHGMLGLTGWAAFEGPVGRFLPVLRMAEVVHVGKGTSFGLGRVQVVVEAQNSARR
jgi:hypothetical protein